MTQAEFAKGWKVLVLQPWGWRYNQLDKTTGLPTEEAKTQLELYYAKLQWAKADAWWSVAQQYAGGTAWPGLQELKHSLQAVQAYHVQSLPAPVGVYITKEEFGLDLYECIKLFAMRHQLRAVRKRLYTNLDISVADKKLKMADMGKEEEELTAKIQALIGTLKREDVKRLLDTYETPEAA